MTPHVFSTLWSSSRLWPAAPQLWNHLWQSTLFAAAAALLALALRRYPARVRYWLWMAASVKFLIPFSFLIAAGSHFARPTPATASETSAYVAIGKISEPFIDAPALTAPGPMTAEPAAAHHFSVSAILTVLWFCGFTAVLALWLLQWRRVARSIRRATFLRGGRVVDSLRRVEQLAGATRAIQVLSSPGPMEPGVFGIFRPILLWPEAISLHLDDAHLEAVLAHEVCHVRRRDNLTSVVHALVEAIFWFHPMVWWMESQLVKERERACDEEVLLLCQRPKAYAEGILKVCEFCVESPLSCVSGITGADLKKRIAEIMAGRAGSRLNLSKRLLLSSVALSVVIAPIVFGLLGGKAAGQAQSAKSVAFAQPPAAAPASAFSPVLLRSALSQAGAATPATATDTAAVTKPVFEVATIKPAKDMPWVGESSAADEFHLPGTSIRRLIESSYNLPPGSDARILGGPGWIDSDQYAIDAKIGDSLAAAMQKMSPEKRLAEIHLMEQSLLADRLKLKVHFETREMPVYMLVVAKGGLKLTPAKDPSPTDPLPVARLFHPEDMQRVQKGLLIIPQGGEKRHMIVKGYTLDEFANMLTPHPEVGGRAVINRTGLSARYDFTLDWAQAEPPTAGAPGAAQSTDPDGPGLFTALQEQLGLKLAPGKGPVEFMVIDHIERPSAN